MAAPQRPRAPGLACRRTLELLEDGLHPAGVALVMCDRRILSSDPGDWDELIAESSAAERYSRRLSERITDGYAAKFEKHDDQAGTACLGLRRSPEPPRVLEIDPETIDRAVQLFERYAIGTVSIAGLAAETGLEAERIQKILRNPIYNGWMRRHRGPDELRRPAPWRANPPVSDALWTQVERIRLSKARGGGPRNSGRVDLLAGLLECVCGRRLRSDGTFGDGRHRKLHPDPCDAWGSSARLPDAIWEAPILAQVAGIRLDGNTIAAVVTTLGSSRPPIAMQRVAVERRMRDLALEHVAGQISDPAYLSRLAEFRGELAALEDSSGGTVSAQRAVEWLRAIGASWLEADLPEEKADLLHAIYERVVVVGRTFVSAHLTPTAYAHGLALALPEVLERPRQDSNLRPAA